MSQFFDIFEPSPLRPLWVTSFMDGPLKKVQPDDEYIITSIVTFLFSDSNNLCFKFSIRSVLSSSCWCSKSFFLENSWMISCFLSRADSNFFISLINAWTSFWYFSWLISLSSLMDPTYQNIWLFWIREWTSTKLEFELGRVCS